MRVAGPDRVATAIALSEEGFDAADVAVLARRDSPADSLATGPVAAADDGPLLLTGRDDLDPRVADELGRLGVDEVVLAGGTAALSQDVEDEVEALGVTVTRLAGSDRYETAVLAAQRVLDGDDDVQLWLALGRAEQENRSWPDALVASWAASTLDDAVLLVQPDVLPDATREALEDLDPSRVRLAGGTGAVSAEVADEAAAAAGVAVERLAGANRYATGAAVVDAVGDAAGDRLFVATGRSFADALAAGPVAADGGTLVLVDGADLAGSPSGAALLEQRGPSSSGAVLVGGTAAVSSLAEDQVADRVGR